MTEAGSATNGMNGRHLQRTRRYKQAIPHGTNGTTGTLTMNGEAGKNHRKDGGAGNV